MRRSLLLIFGSLFLILNGCGGGGSGGVGGGGGTGTSASGTAAFGIIKNGTVKIYALNADGSRGSLLGTASTNSAGSYSQSLGSYSGPIVAYAYGSYVDEATGTTVTLTESNALRAALPAASGTVSLAITGLTELAVREAGSQLTASAITTANSAVSSIFKVNVTAVNPVEATTSALGAAGVTAKQRDYTLALAAMSQLASTAAGVTPTEKLATLLSALSQAIDGSSLAPATAAAFTQALHDYLQTHTDINAIVTSNGGSPIITVGYQTGIISLSLATPAGVSGAEFTLNLPAGVTVHHQSDGSTSNAVVGLTPATKSDWALGKYTAAVGSTPGTVKLALAAGTPVGSGGILVINADVAPGTAVTKESFAITGATLVDQNGVAVTGASLAVSGVVVQ
jgi:hypothetical protein